VGNRVVGDRLREAVGLERAKVAAALVMTSPFVPMTFQGEEWAASSPFQYFADHEDAELARLVSAGRKKEFAAFGWGPEQIPDPEKRETFERSRLNWTERNEGEHGEMLAWYRKLIGLRKATPELNDSEPGKTRVAFDEEARWLVVRRADVQVLCNLGSKAHAFAHSSQGTILLASHEGVAADGVAVTLPPDSVAIVRSR